ncbi:hypothetical protein [Arenibaculum sp.]|jgi:hypothetical protein|uniref:hypothetical protein n=1 Tax=Arenibaculum sp. TaxID=2865862 RepID=UPI002E118E06|nr:hypothetical protein [Arenibaculum sp.]
MRVLVLAALLPLLSSCDTLNLRDTGEGLLDALCREASRNCTPPVPHRPVGVGRLSRRP